MNPLPTDAPEDPMAPGVSPVMQTIPPSTPNIVYIPVQAQKRGFNPLGVAAFVISIFSYFYNVASVIDGTRWIGAVALVAEIVLIVFAFRAAKQKYLGRGLTIAALVITCFNAYFLFILFLFGDYIQDFVNEYSTVFTNSIFDRLSSCI